jgi:hypothetical protein
MRRLSSTLSPSMLVALLALFVALGGSAYAVTTATAPANSVVTKSIKKGAVTPLKIASGAVGASQLALGAVGASQLAPGAVGASQLGAKAVGTGQLGDGAVGTTQLADGAITGTKVGKSTITAGNIDLPTLAIPKPTTYTVRQTTVQSHAFAKEDQFQLLAACLPGETVTGGGGRTSNGRISLSESIPFTGSTEQRWGVLFHNNTADPLTVQVTAFAICASS